MAVNEHYNLLNEFFHSENFLGNAKKETKIKLNGKKIMDAKEKIGLRGWQERRETTR
jgi:hypothetical protein